MDTQKRGGERKSHPALLTFVSLPLFPPPRRSYPSTVDSPVHINEETKRQTDRQTDTERERREREERERRAVVRGGLELREARAATGETWSEMRPKLPYMPWRWM